MDAGGYAVRDRTALHRRRADLGARATFPGSAREVEGAAWICGGGAQDRARDYRAASGQTAAQSHR